MDIDEKWMKKAITLAKKGIGTTHPNPRVGAVVVNDGKVVGQGWHERAGEPHAEAVALEKAGNKARGGTLYVTLEPCAARGRTPACTDAILHAGIRQVVFASSDPNPKMAGGGKVLAAYHVEVQGGVLAEEADALNVPFFHYVRTGFPYVTGKAAISLDGKLATRTHHSQWISGEKSRKHAHGLRATSDAIIIGAGTLMHDNPSLTVRDAKSKGKPPLRVVLCFETPPFNPDCKLLSDDAPTRFYVRSTNEHTQTWHDAGVEVGKVNSLPAILRHLAEQGYLEILLEGGGQLHSAFLDGRFTSEMVLYQAPILIGGRDGVSLWGGFGAETVTQAPRLAEISRRKMDEDYMIRGKVIYPD
ncbi:MAG TPA: bifunctional diaminohydroxyphosphoribosylaminopyrimidine deaminase/5-amino-6-(5-phosphoribosylamino)uracil reductase RibD [Mariprofundaceae bacterium]|nr:bifunctional diaminohydroxyphosphoribosylaminopyrimidine deaminase/5-amino-6-(5-phosphoribosylamino)uracil reductase RibD [Mariprofundaceae bacterium]